MSTRGSRFSIFPVKEGIYLIAIRAMVRGKEHIQEGDSIFIEFVAQ